MNPNPMIGDLFDLSHSLSAPLLQTCRYPWEALDSIRSFVAEIGSSLNSSVYIQRSEHVYVARDALIAPTAFIGDYTIIAPGAEIRHCAYIRGAAIVGSRAVVGNSCELKNCILFDEVQVPHFNYIGDSILGYHSHLGAGAVTSNVKSDKSAVCIRDGNVSLETGRKKLGAIIGDQVEIGCNSVLCPGTVIGRNTTVYPLSRVRGVIPANSIFKAPDNIVRKH